MATIPVADIELDVERSGSGSPLLAIMGMSGTALHWGEPFLEGLREDFEVIAYDHRGVGASTRLEGAVTIPQMAADAAGLLAALGIERADVLGISMGGMIAQELALAHPELIRTLILGCTYAGGADAVAPAPEVAQRMGEAIMSGDRRRAIRTGFEVNVSAAAAADEDLYARFLAVSERRAVAPQVVMAQLQACMAHDTRSRLSGIGTPTLVIHGTEDQLLPVENGRILATAIPGAQLEILEGIGHAFFWEQPQHAAQLVREHAART